LRLKLLYNTDLQPIVIQANSDLPEQGKCYESIASVQVSDVTRKIRQCQFFQAPPEIFDYVLFSESDLVKKCLVVENCPMEFFGLDIGSHQVKIVKISKSGNQRRLMALGTAPSTQKGILSESENDLTVLSNIIKNFIRRQKLALEMLFHLYLKTKFLLR